MRVNKNGGFTLIELMVVVAIVALLAALAYDNYSRYAFRSRRVDGQNLLTNIAAAEQRYYTNYNSYTSTIAGTTSALGMKTDSERGYYSGQRERNLGRTNLHIDGHAGWHGTTEQG